MENRDLLSEYLEQFGECFPTYSFMNREKEMEKEIIKCLEEGKPFEEDEELQELLNNPDVKF